MKELQKYIPLLLVSLAAILGVYFLWLKPKQDKEKAEQAAAQAANDAAIVSGAGYNSGVISTSTQNAYAPATKVKIPASITALLNS